MRWPPRTRKDCRAARDLHASGRRPGSGGRDPPAGPPPRTTVGMDLAASSLMRLLACLPFLAAACTSTSVPSGTAPAPVGEAVTSSPEVSLRATSTRRSKRDVRYIDDMDAFALRDDLVGLRLATFQYVDEPRDAKVRLGFMVEDSPAVLAVDRSKEAVDLYSFVSMAVAAIQVQQAEIQQLHDELHAAVKTGCALQRPHPEL
jgi:hypothetical protein